jgi:hypothetical protein
MGRMRSRDPVHFGVDYFKAYIEKDAFKKSPLFWAWPGSNEINYDGITTIILHPMMWWDSWIGKYFEIRDNVTARPLAFILLSSWETVGSVKRNDQIEVTGQWLILRSIPYFYSLLNWAGFFIKGFRRVDICLDIRVDTDYLCRNILIPWLERKAEQVKKKALSEWKDPKCRMYKPWVWNKGEYETLDIWQRAKSNTWLFIRVYNKWLDTTKKKKWWLYDEEKITKDTSRIEVELREDKCLGIHDYDLLDTEKLFWLFKRSVFWLNYQFFSFIHEDQCKLLINSHIKEVFDGSKDWNPSKWLKHKQIAERLDRQEKLWTSFLNTWDKDRAITTFSNLYKKLRINWFDQSQLFWILENIENKVIEEHKKKHEISDF